MKQNDYLCPSCKGHLNAGEKVIFAAKNNRNKRGLLLLSPDVGEYELEHHDNFTFEKGELLGIACPICASDLATAKNKAFAEVVMVDHNNQEYEVLFSRKVGERSTYVVAKDNIDVFGEDAMNYDDLFEEY